jgi:hypothetical protein
MSTLFVLTYNETLSVDISRPIYSSQVLIIYCNKVLEDTRETIPT